jgi:diguanylate cyclase (GGDEF)-like protein
MPPALPYALPSLAGALLALLVALHVFRYQTGPGWRALSLLGGAALWWCLAGALSTLAGEPEVRRILVASQYLAIAPAPVLWFLVARAYIPGGRWGSGRWPFLLFVVPAITVAVAFTNPGHGYLWSGFDLPGGGPGVDVAYGPWFFVHLVYSYTLTVVGTVLLVLRFASSPLYRRQFAVVVAGTGLFFVTNLLHLTRVVVFPLDPTPLALVVVFVAFGWAVREHRLLEVVPVARGMMVERLREGVLVADGRGIIVDANRAATFLLAGWREPPLGGRLADLIPPALLQDPEGECELRMDGGRILELRFSALSVAGGEVEGTAVLVRDVSEERAARAELVRARDELDTLNRELQRLARTDSLTALANRRRLFEELEREWARAERGGGGLAFLLLDLDLFKRVNDTRGHLAGDRVLTSVGEILSAVVRPQDLPARFGGEEFAVLLTETDPVSAELAAARILEALRQFEHRDEGGHPFQVTASGGLAFRESGDRDPTDLLARADDALYSAKEAGRDRLSVARRDPVSPGAGRGP